MPDETPSLDAQLESFFADPAAVAAEEPKLGDPTLTPATKDEPVKDPADAVVEPPVAEPTLDEQFAALDEKEEKPADKVESKLTAEQEQILKLIPSPQVAEVVAQNATNYRNIVDTFEAGRFEDFENMFRQWRPDLYNQYCDHVVDRWIAEKELEKGNPAVSREVQALQHQLKQLQQQMQGRSQQEQSASRQAADQKAYGEYNTYIDGLFNSIKFSEADRPFIKDILVARVINSPEVKQRIMSGQPNAVYGIFKQVIKDYVQRDQATSQVKEGLLGVQDRHKAPLAGVPQAESTIPSDIKDVPREKLGEWEDQELAKLFSKKKR